MINQRIPLSTPYLNGREWKYIKNCLDEGWVSSVGPAVDSFEKKLEEKLGIKHAVVLCSGSAALHMALISLGIGKNDEVIVPTLTFAAPAFAVCHSNATPVFIDVEPKYLQIDVEKCQDFIVNGCRYTRGKLINKSTRRHVKAIIAVDILGHPCDWRSLRTLARKYNLFLIEDAAESLGASLGNKKCGTFGDIACLSFNGNKIITCGGGGALLTNSSTIANRVRHLSTQAKINPIEYIHDEIGYNYRLNNLQAAMGLAQLESLDEYVIKKTAIAKRYANQMKCVGISHPHENKSAVSNWWLYTILVDHKQYGINSRELMKALSSEGVQTRPLWHPLHALSIFSKVQAWRIEHAMPIYYSALSLPSSPNLKDNEQEFVISLIKKFRKS